MCSHLVKDSNFFPVLILWPYCGVLDGLADDESLRVVVNAFGRSVLACHDGGVIRCVGRLVEEIELVLLSKSEYFEVVGRK